MEMTLAFPNADLVVHLSRPPEGEWVRVSVEDSGAGVPEEMLSRLGERLLRLDPSRSRLTPRNPMSFTSSWTILARAN